MQFLPCYSIPIIPIILNVHRELLISFVNLATAFKYLSLLVWWRLLSAMFLLSTVAQALFRTEVDNVLYISSARVGVGGRVRDVKIDAFEGSLLVGCALPIHRNCSGTDLQFVCLKRRRKQMIKHQLLI